MPEWNCWAYVDLTDGNIFVKKGSHFLNTLDLYAVLQSGTAVNDGITTYHFNGDRIVSMPFSGSATFAYYYFHPGNSFQFFYSDFLKREIPKNLFERAKKFFYLKPYYATYSANITQGNYQFYFRLITNYLLVLICIIWFFTVVAYIKRRNTS